MTLHHKIYGYCIGPTTLWSVQMLGRNEPLTVMAEQWKFQQIRQYYQRTGPALRANRVKCHQSKSRSDIGLTLAGWCFPLSMPFQWQPTNLSLFSKRWPIRESRETAVQTSRSCTNCTHFLPTRKSEPMLQNSRSRDFLGSRTFGLLQYWRLCPSRLHRRKSPSFIVWHTSLANSSTYLPTYNEILLSGGLGLETASNWWHSSQIWTKCSQSLGRQAVAWQTHEDVAKGADCYVWWSWLSVLG